MMVIGIDPGTRHLGWGVVRTDGTRLCHVASGVVDLSPALPLANRLVVLERQLDLLLTHHRPRVASVEQLFFHKDPQAAAKLGHARGVVLLALARRDIAVHEYAPARVKLTVAGSGRADKKQVSAMVCRLLSLTSVPRVDASDALAIALTHLRRAPVARAIERARAR